MQKESSFHPKKFGVPQTLSNLSTGRLKAKFSRILTSTWELSLAQSFIKRNLNDLDMSFQRHTGVYLGKQSTKTMAVIIKVYHKSYTITF